MLPLMKTTATLALAVAAIVALMAPANALPRGWTGLGGFGTLGPDGVVPAPPGFSSVYAVVTTYDGIAGIGALPGVGGIGSPTNGSLIQTNNFVAFPGAVISFYFNFVTSDGAGYADYVWARLNDGSPSGTVLFTARTTPGGNTVPGFSMPTIAMNVSLTPGFVEIQPGAPTWSGIGDSTNRCFSDGCGTTGWIKMEYIIDRPGIFSLTFGATNWIDTFFDTGMAIAGVALDGATITGVPVPMSLALLAVGLLGLAPLAVRPRLRV